MSEDMLQRLIKRRETLAAEREDLINKRKAIVQVAKEEAREDLSEEEDAEFQALTQRIEEIDNDEDAGLKRLDQRIAQLSDETERSKRAEVAARRLKQAEAAARVTEGRTYEKGNGRSYFRDLTRAQVLGDDDARERLQRHAQDVAEQRDLDRTDGSGGYFVPPLWLMSQWVELARAGRAIANVVTNQELPSGTDSINVPKIATGTTTAVQTADNAAVSETDLTDTSVTAPVRTIAGQQDVAVQLLDQSPVSFDEVIFRDLVADYATKVDLQVISGSNSNGQVKGIRNATGIETVTAGTATVAAVYAKLADAVQRVQSNRFMPATVIAMHPRRWGWFLAALDSTDRPLVLPAAGVPQNAMGTLSAQGGEQVVGQMHGLPVITDPNLPTTLGAGTNEDVIHVYRASDLYLYESGIRTRVFPGPGSATLTVRLQVYGYIAFTAERYPKSIAEIGGAGLVAPTF